MLRSMVGKGSICWTNMRGWTPITKAALAQALREAAATSQKMWSKCCNTGKAERDRSIPEIYPKQLAWDYCAI